MGSDQALKRYRKYDHLELVMGDGTAIREPIREVRRYELVLESGRVVNKIECVGVFPRAAQDVILSRSHPKVPVPAKPSERKNRNKIKKLGPKERLARLRLVLVNGWEVEGSLLGADPYELVVRVRAHRVLNLFRHGIADFQVVFPPETNPDREELASYEKGKQEAREKAMAQALSSSAPRGSAPDLGSFGASAPKSR